MVALPSVPPLGLVISSIWSSGSAMAAPPAESSALSLLMAKAGLDRTSAPARSAARDAALYMAQPPRPLDSMPPSGACPAGGINTFFVTMGNAFCLLVFRQRLAVAVQDRQQFVQNGCLAGQDALPGFGDVEP